MTKGQIEKKYNVQIDEKHEWRGKRIGWLVYPIDGDKTICECKTLAEVEQQLEISYNKENNCDE